MNNFYCGSIHIPNIHAYAQIQIGWAFWVRKVGSAIEHRPESMAVKSCAAAEVIKREYVMLKRNVNAVLFGAVMSNAKCAIIEGRSIFAIKNGNRIL